MDAVTTFFHGDLEEEIYMLQAERFTSNQMVIGKLQKSIYGLRQQYNKFLQVITFSKSLGIVRISKVAVYNNNITNQ